MTIHYHAFVNQPGYLPDTDEPTPAFNTPAAAWQYLVDSLSDEERWQPEDQEDPNGPHEQTKLACELEKMERVSAVGTVYNGDLTLAYSVDLCAEEDCEVDGMSDGDKIRITNVSYLQEGDYLPNLGIVNAIKPLTEVFTLVETYGPVWSPVTGKSETKTQLITFHATDEIYVEDGEGPNANPAEDEGANNG